MRRLLRLRNVGGWHSRQVEALSFPDRKKEKEKEKKVQMSTLRRIGAEAIDDSRNGEAQRIRLRQHPSTANLVLIRAVIS